MIQMMLDRQVDCSVEYAPGADAACVPRLKTSRSKYTIKANIATVSKHEHQLSCQLDALIPVAMELLYGKKEIPQAVSDAQNAKLKSMLNKLRKET